jgi:FkbM family methyltransferase
MIIEIGTSDFRTQAGEVDGIFIEPVKYYFDKLPSCKKENVAISNTNGTLKMFYLTDVEIKKYKLPNWIRGCNSINTIHPAIVNQLNKRGISHDIVNVDDVPVVRIKSILDKYEISEIDYLKVDTEGHDCIILNDFLDTVDILPKKIMFENNVLSSSNDVALLIDRLSSDYNIEKLEADVICTLKK